MKPHTLAVLVENKAGVLSRVTGLFSRRGFNIHSLAVGPTENPEVSRMTIVVAVEGLPLEQVTKQLNKVREDLAVPDVEMIVSSGRDWQQAVENTGWAPGDVLLLGSGAAGQSARVFLGSAAAKILRHSPVPVMIMPRT